MKGLDISISLVIILMVGLATVVVLATLISGNISGLESFATEQIGNFEVIPD